MRPAGPHGQVDAAGPERLRCGRPFERLPCSATRPRRCSPGWRIARSRKGAGVRRRPWWPKPIVRNDMAPVRRRSLRAEDDHGAEGEHACRSNTGAEKRSWWPKVIVQIGQ